MKVSRLWTSDLLTNFRAGDQEVADRLSQTLAEVEKVTRRNDWLGDKVVIGRIEAIESHPQADRLQLAQVSTGRQTWSIVCGATNIRPGQIVPLALVGSRVLTPEGKVTTIQAAKIRGVVSQGMMCSQRELGAGDDHQGIWILPSDWEKYLGRPLRQVLPELQDTVWEIDNKALTHRPDCFGQLGMAREIAAATRAAFHRPDWYQEDWQPKEVKKEIALAAEVQDPDRCPRYSALAISGVKIGPSPLWLQQRLLSVGARPINNIVDVTNYLMLELGQPLHAFSAQKLAGTTIIVRRARAGEKFVSLDGQQHRLGPADLVIADNKKAVALAGIIGGANSEIDEKTETVILEAANFSKAGIRRSAMRLGIRTEASLRFEKNLDPNLTRPALARAVELIQKVSPGAYVASELVDVYPRPVKPKTIRLQPDFVNRILGAKITPAQMKTILNSLELKTEARGKTFLVHIPTFRRDLQIAEDLVEEVGRIYGYDRLPLVLPRRDLTPAPVNRDLAFSQKTKQLLLSLGFDEIYTYAFVGEDLMKQCRRSVENLIPLQNPLSPELAYLQDSLRPGLLMKAALNRPHFANFALFELARVFRSGPDRRKLPQQPKMVAGLVVSEKDGAEAYRDLKGRLEVLLARLLIPAVTFQPLKDAPDLHPGQQVAIFSSREQLGVVGSLHPLVAANFGLEKAGVAIFEMEMAKLQRQAQEKITYRPPLKASLVKIDVSLPAASWQEAWQKLAAVMGKYLERHQLLDFYRGKYTVRLWLRPGPATTGANLQKLLQKLPL